MAIPVWPASLPQFMRRDDHHRQLGDGRLKSSTDVGPGKLRRKTSATVKPVACSFVVSRAQLVEFEAFWNEDTAGGTQRFWFPEIGRHGYPLSIDDGDDLLLSGAGSPLLISAWWLVQFSPDAEPPSMTSISDTVWQIAMQLEVLP